MRYHLTPQKGYAIIKKTSQITSIGKDVTEKNSYTLLMGMWISAATMENSMKFPQKNKNRITMWSSNSIPGYIERKQRHYFKNLYALQCL